MDYSALKEIIKLVSDSKLTTFELEQEGTIIRMKKEAAVVEVREVSNKIIGMEQKTTSIVSEETSEVVVKAGEIVKSPIVGTYYEAPGTDKPSFVKVGDKVKKGDVLCIIEAMKIMNEIQSDYDGEILEILVNNEDMVEYGQPLFRVVES